MEIRRRLRRSGVRNRTVVFESVHVRPPGEPMTTRSRSSANPELAASCCLPGKRARHALQCAMTKSPHEVFSFPQAASFTAELVCLCQKYPHAPFSYRPIYFRSRLNLDSKTVISVTQLANRPAKAGQEQRDIQFWHEACCNRSDFYHSIHGDQKWASSSRSGLQKRNLWRL